MPIGTPTARTRANRKYNEKAYDRIGLMMKKGERDVVKQAAAAAGMTLNAYIVEAVKARMTAEGITFPEPEDEIPERL